MGLGLLLLPALGGYWALTRANCWKYGALRESGYHLVFRSACLGGLLSAIAYLPLLALSYAVPDLGVDIKCWLRLSEPLTLVQAAVGIGTVSGFALPYGVNRRKKETDAERDAKETDAEQDAKETDAEQDAGAAETPLSWWRRLRCTELEGARRAAAERGDLIELTLQDSAQRPTTVEIALNSGKTYIGYATVSGIFQRDASEPDIALLPVVSGYRDRNTQELKLTTSYGRYYDEIAAARKEWGEGQGTSLEDMRVILPLSEIRSARLFDLELQAKLEK